MEIENCLAITWIRRATQFQSDEILQLIRDGGFQKEFDDLLLDGL
jgi:hypothetical protein